jgi:hypothetical protein
MTEPTIEDFTESATLQGQALVTLSLSLMHAMGGLLAHEDISVMTREMWSQPRAPEEALKLAGMIRLLLDEMERYIIRKGVVTMQ